MGTIVKVIDTGNSSVSVNKNNCIVKVLRVPFSVAAIPTKLSQLTDDINNIVAGDNISELTNDSDFAPRSELPEAATDQQALNGVSGVFPDAKQVHDAFNQYGLGATNIPAFTDANDATTSGSMVRVLAGSPNNPYGSTSSAAILVLGNGTGRITQLAFAPHYSSWGDAVKFRSFDTASNSWSDWQEIHHTGNGATTAEAQAGTSDSQWMSPVKVHEAFNRYGLGSKAKLTVIDWDTYFDNKNTEIGAILTNVGSVNGPPVGVFYYPQVMILSGSAGNKIVIAWPYRSNIEKKPYYRIQIGGFWSTWVPLITGLDAASSTEIVGATNTDKWISPKALDDAYGANIIGSTAAVYSRAGSPDGSRLKIRLPFIMSSNRMVKFTLDVYASYSKKTYECSGYLYATNNNWFAPKYTYHSDETFVNHDLVFGRDDDGRAYVSMNDLFYTVVAVRDVIYGNGSSQHGSVTFTDWEFSSDDSTPNTVTAERTVLHDTNNGATTAEAEAGTNDSKWMSPEKVHAAFNQYGVGSLAPLVSEGAFCGRFGGFFRVSDGSSDGPAGTGTYGKYGVSIPRHVTSNGFGAAVWFPYGNLIADIVVRTYSNGQPATDYTLLTDKNASSGQNLQTVWTGSATSVDLNTLPGGYPGDGWYAVTTTGYNLKGFCFFDDGVTTGNTIYRVDGITTETIVKDGSNTVTVRNELNALQTFNLIQKVV